MERRPADGPRTGREWVDPWISRGIRAGQFAGAAYAALRIMHANADDGSAPEPDFDPAQGQPLQSPPAADDEGALHSGSGQGGNILR